MDVFFQFSQILGFNVSKNGIHINPMNVQEIIYFLAPSLLVQLKILQGKVNFQCRFIPNYRKFSKGFTYLLKKGVPFHWDHTTHNAFDALKDVLA